MVVLSDEVVCEYKNQDAFDDARALLSIHLC